MTNRDEEAPDARQDAAWQAIVQNFGDRAELDEAELAAEPESVPEPDRGPLLELPAELDEVPWDDEGHYVPPEAPPATLPKGPRRVAWFGLFGVPAIALLLLVLGVRIPSLLGFLFVVSFVGSFGYLVATMTNGRDPDRGWDDGAVL